MHGININNPYPKLNGEERKDAITPLTQATAENNIPLIRFLMSQGAEIMPAVLRSLSTSISFGIEEAVQIMEIFVSNGASINMYDELGGIMHTNFFHYESHAKFLAFLLENGLSTQITNKEGRSLLHVAAEAADWTQSALLIAHGADLYLQDLAGKTPFDVAYGDRFKEHLKARFKEYQEKQAKDPHVRTCPALQKFALGFVIEPREPTFREKFDSLSDAAQAAVVEELKANPPGVLVDVIKKASASETESPYSDIPILDINPQIKSKDAGHCMLIICDAGVTEPKGGFKGATSELGYIGHYYIGLGELRDGVVSKMHSYSGYNPVQTLPIERGKVLNEADRYEQVKKAEEAHGKGIVKSEKAIPLTEMQYSKIKNFAAQKKEHPGIYIAGWHDCITFTQDVLDMIGLEHYKVGDLISLSKESRLTLARLSAGGRGCDNKIVEAICKEEVAQKYNVPLDRVDDIYAAPGEVPKFRILPLGIYLKMKAQSEQ